MDKKTILSVALGAVLATSLFASLFVFQIVGPIQPAQTPKQTQASQTLQKFKASGAVEAYAGAFLVIDAGTERGIWSNNGLAPEWDIIRGPFTPTGLEKQVVSGNKIGFFTTSDILLARYNGVPIKIVACFIGDSRANKIYAKPDSPIKSMRDLDGKKVGVWAIDSGTGRVASYLSNKFEIKPELIPLGNETNMVVALKVGKIDAFSGGGIHTDRLVDSGELRILAVLSDFIPKPTAGLCIFAAEDLIEQKPDLVKRFVKATLESVKYLDKNPSYAAELYSKKTNAPKDLAQKVSSDYEWTPGGRGSGADLSLAVKNRWEVIKDIGIVPAGASLKIEDAVDVRFLP